MWFQDRFLLCAPCANIKTPCQFFLNSSATQIPNVAAAIQDFDSCARERCASLLIRRIRRIECRVPFAPHGPSVRRLLPQVFPENSAAHCQPLANAAGSPPSARASRNSSSDSFSSKTSSSSSGGACCFVVPSLRKPRCKSSIRRAQSDRAKCGTRRSTATSARATASAHIRWRERNYRDAASSSACETALRARRHRSSTSAEARRNAK